MKGLPKVRLIQLKKFLRYVHIYGLKRTVIKSFGRTRLKFPFSFFLMPTSIFKNKNVAVIGCGQFAFSTIAYFVNSYSNSRIFLAYDINNDPLESFSKFYAVKKCKTIDSIWENDINLVYIASNHYTHTTYAIEALKRGVDVYIEKPISVNDSQLETLTNAIEKSKSRIFCGYNRPHSPAIKKLKLEMDDSPFSLNMFIVGHFLDENHWYRNKNEGTRVCGNLGHWLDLTIHLLNGSGITQLDVNIIYSDENTPDDNLQVILKSNRGDLISIMLTSRSEPFEGINENICFHQRDYQVVIDDFRMATFQRLDNKEVIKYRKKDVGHKNAILQPFESEYRNFDEVITSSRLMLKIKNMVQSNNKYQVFSWN
jgi:predicted dehydrogenase